jgi:predicted anti-sigma-YlaC factor YlaD
MEHSDNCRKFLNSLSDYVDGVLQEELCAEIERHMSDCEDCRIVIDTLRKTVYLYRNSPMPSAVPDDVRQRLFHRLDLDDFLNR